jgi:hypothetical protein
LTQIALDAGLVMNKYYIIKNYTRSMNVEIVEEYFDKGSALLRLDMIKDSDPENEYLMTTKLITR